jgi:hypothetical protein
MLIAKQEALTPFTQNSSSVILHTESADVTWCFLMLLYKNLSLGDQLQKKVI